MTLCLKSRRHILILISIILAAPAMAGYNESWFKAPYWSGEWPRGLAIAKPDITVMARSEMDKDKSPSVRCTLPYRAVLHPWNYRANRDRHIEYWTASKIRKLKAKTNFYYTFESLDQKLRKPVMFSIKKNEVIEYLIYGAEGWFTVRVRNSLFAAEQDLLNYVTEQSDRGLQDPGNTDEFDEWLKLPCGDMQTAWILKSDLKKPDGQTDINSSNYIDGIWPAMMGDPGIDDYGLARDLTEEEIKRGYPN